METNKMVVQNPAVPAVAGTGAWAGFGVTPAQTVVIAHHDVHGITAGYLIAKAFGAVEVYSNFPQTAPENVVSTLQNLFAAASTRLRIVIVDIPVDLKNPAGFIRGLEDIALRHEVVFIDHHESSVQFLSQFRNVKVIFLGPSALTLNNYLLSQVPNATDLDRTIALVGAVGDRDPEIVRQNLFNAELQRISDGLDVLVRERDGALRAIRALMQNPGALLEEARERANQIPTAQLFRRVGPVAVAQGPLPAGWGPKALEKLAFAVGAWYAVGWGVDDRTKTPIARAIIRWDVSARIPGLPMPGSVARALWPTRNVIGHPAAPSIAGSSEAEVQEMALTLAQALADAAVKSAAPSAVRFIPESDVGMMFVEVLQRLEQLLQEQQKMYQEYLELKRRQVELLQRGERRAAD
jgi:hypothetical protein